MNAFVIYLWGSMHNVMSTYFEILFFSMHKLVQTSRVFAEQVTSCIYLIHFLLVHSWALIALPYGIYTLSLPFGIRCESTIYLSKLWMLLVTTNSKLISLHWEINHPSYVVQVQAQKSIKDAFNKADLYLLSDTIIIC